MKNIVTDYVHNIMLNYATIIILFVSLLFLLPNSVKAQIPDSTYFLSPPKGWHLIGEATTVDHQQCFGYGDFDGDEASELVGNYSHSAVGLFIHDFDGSAWTKSVIHPKFDPANRIQGMDGSWPVKGVVTGDFDGDGLVEIITMADQIMYPPIHQEPRYPFPGCIYVDWNEAEQEFTANPLVWGTWGEKIGSNKASIMMMIPVSTLFRASGSCETQKDFLVKTLCNNVDGRADSRLFVLQQPPKTFSEYDYRYVMPDSMDANPTYPNDAFYVHRLYLETEEGDVELYFPYSDAPFPDVVSANCTADIFDYDNDGLYDLFVTVAYMDSDDEEILRLCGTSIQIYHRLPAEEDRHYRFELAFRKDMAGLTLRQPNPANLNGDPADGKEGWIMGVRIDTSMTNSLQTRPGVVTVYPDGESWKVLGTRPDSMSLNQYSSTYGYISVCDFDQDGYDDVVAQCNKEPKVVPYNLSQKYMVSDLKLFRNMAGEVRGFEELFTHESKGSRILWPDDAFNWDIHMEDFDDDGQMELGCALSRREPAWGNILGKYGIYFTELAWDPTSIEYNEDGKVTPVHFSLHQNFPNPFNSSTTIRYNLQKPGKVNLRIHNNIGQEIETLAKGFKKAGEYELIWRSDGLPSGIYLYRLQVGNSFLTKKIILQK